jgi:predicted SAM-dependent methyltransferase
MTYRLDIGCGIYRRDGFTGVDIDPACAPDICAPMDAIPLPDASVAELWSSHALEHVSKFKVVPVLKEWRRLLVVGGVGTIEVPDLEWCCRNWLFRRTNDWHMDVLFGQATSEAEQHRTGFTKDIMASYLREAGLTLLNWSTVDSHGQPTLRFEVQRQS